MPDLGYDFAKMNKEINELRRCADELDAWLIDNIDHPDYSKKMSEWHNLNFKIAQKTQKIESLESGTRDPETLYMGTIKR